MTPNEIVNRRMSCHDEANLSFYERAAYRAELVAEIEQAIREAVLEERLAWIPVSQEPHCAYVLMAGKNLDGTWWRDVGVYRGKQDGIMDFRDKYGADSHPSHWMPLPDTPNE